MDKLSLRVFELKRPRWIACVGSGWNDHHVVDRHVRAPSPLRNSDISNSLTKKSYFSMSFFVLGLSFTMVRKELGRVVGEGLWFLVIAAVPLLAALSVDIYSSVQLIYSPETTLAWVYALSLPAMYGGVALFTVYDRHYFSKVLRKNILHSLLFALVVVLILIPSEYTAYQFMAKTIEYTAIPTHHSLAETLYGLAMLLCMILFVVGSPFIAHLTCKLAERFFKRKT